MTMTKYEHLFLERGQTFHDHELRGIHLLGANTDIGAPDDQRPTIENVKVKSLWLSRCGIDHAVLRNVEVDGLRIDGYSGIVQANEYYGFTLRGKLKGEVTFASYSTSTGFEGAYARRLVEAERAPGWSIDISEAIGSISVRGYSADGFTINPEYQAVVRNDPSSMAGWELLDYSAVPHHITFRMMVEHGWKDTVITADGTAKNFEDQLALLHLLREKGIAE